MDALAKYLVTAQSFTENVRETEKVKELYEKDPETFEEKWQELFQDTGSHTVSQFARLLEEKGLYLEYARYSPWFERDFQPLKLYLRVYSFGTEVGYVACLKVVVMER